MPIGIYDNLDPNLNLNTVDAGDFNKAVIGSQVILYSGASLKSPGQYLALNVAVDANTPQLFKKPPADDAAARSDGVATLEPGKAGGFYMIINGTWALCANSDFIVRGSKMYAMEWYFTNVRAINGTLVGQLYAIDTNGDKNYLYEFDKTTLKVSTISSGTKLPGDNEWTIGIDKFSDTLVQWFTGNSLPLRNQCCQATPPASLPTDISKWCASNQSRLCTTTASPSTMGFTPTVLTPKTPKKMMMLDLPDKPVVAYCMTPPMTPKVAFTPQSLFATPYPPSPTAAPEKIKTFFQNLKAVFSAGNMSIIVMFTLIAIIVAVVAVGMSNVTNSGSTKKRR